MGRTAPPSVAHGTDGDCEPARDHVVGLRRRGDARIPRRARRRVRGAQTAGRGAHDGHGAQRPQRRRRRLDEALHHMERVQRARRGRPGQARAVRLLGGGVGAGALDRFLQGDHHKRHLRREPERDRRRLHTHLVLQRSRRECQRIRHVQGRGGQQAQLPGCDGARRADLAGTREEEQPQGG